jgi:hypothetical protein
MASTARKCLYANGFTLWEKLWAQLSFFTMLIVGTAGIALADWRWLAPYIAAGWYGVPGIVMRHQTCPRCAHLYAYGDCLQFPPTLTKLIVKERKTAPFSTAEKITFWLIFLILPLYPLYWLRAEPILLGVFVLSAAMWYSGQWLYFCKRCRVRRCPFNRVQAASTGAG